MRIVVAVFLAALALGARGDPVEQLFADSCAPCHTIGHGDGAGPDLLASTSWPTEELRVAIKRMEANIGPLTDAQVDSLIAFLQRTAKPAPAPEPKKMGDARNGSRLFFGEQTLANGGSPCFACHAIAGRGGNLAKDLAQKKTTEAALTNPPFPMMKAAYARHPVTTEEAPDLVAYLEAAGKPVRHRDLVHVGAMSFAGVIFGGIALIFGARRAGVRARLANKR